MTAVTEPADQQAVHQTMIVNGVRADVSVALLKAQAGSSNVYKFTSGFPFHWRGQTLTFKTNHVYPLDAALKTALLAASAPMVAQ